jgi:hypothetical protein
MRLDPVAKRVDWIDANNLYIGVADAGALTSEAVWQIRRMTITSGATPDVTVLWADGDTAADNIWDNRGSLSYS